MSSSGTLAGSDFRQRPILCTEPGSVGCAMSYRSAVFGRDRHFEYLKTGDDVLRLREWSQSLTTVEIESCLQKSRFVPPVSTQRQHPFTQLLPQSLGDFLERQGFR